MNSQFKVQWTSPSNIALVKYWGKFEDQLPLNPSISFTLKKSVTSLSIEATKSSGPSMNFYFEGQENNQFQKKISVLLEKHRLRFPWLQSHHLDIRSSNTFPHSSGIASSASSMSALSLGLLSLDELIIGKKLESELFFKSASELSRLASGSASRSVYGGVTSWGESSAISLSSNLFATPFNEVHSVFLDYCDSILIVDKKEKSVSSRAGHSLMENHPYRVQRFARARENVVNLTAALKSGDLVTFIQIVEEEALNLHALMMTSSPPYLLLKPESLLLIEKIKEFREITKTPVCFTIDAGPNIHLLYPRAFKNKVQEWIEKNLVMNLPSLTWIHDEIGNGPVRN